MAYLHTLMAQSNIDAETRPRKRALRDHSPLARN